MKKQSVLLSITYTFIGLISLIDISWANPATSSTLNTKKPRLQTSDSTSENTRLSALLFMSNQSRRDERSQNQVFELAAELDFYYEAQSWMSLHITPKFNYSTGYTDSQKPTDASEANWEIKQAYLNLSSAAGLGGKFGALNQRTQLSPLAIGSRAFPAAGIYWKSDYDKNKNWRLNFKTQYAIPSSTNLSTEKTNKETMPNLNTLGVELGYKQRRVKFELQANYFSFNDLPTSVSYEASFLGNTTINSGPQLREFAYDFRGLNLALDTSLLLTPRLKFELSLEAVRNQAAPNGSNSAYRASTSLPMMYNRNLILSPTFQYYRIESDAFISSFNSYTTQTNRIGYATGLDTQLMQKFKLSAFGGEREVLVINPTQSKESWIEFKLETNYEI